MKDNLSLFEDTEASVEQGNEWVGMPEYNNINLPKPVITATFKFASKEDYLKFKELVQEHIYNGDRVFDGMQRKDKKQAWFPHKEKGSRYKYV